MKWFIRFDLERYLREQRDREGQRRFVRLPVRLALLYRLPGRRDFHECRIEDVSRDGIGVVILDLSPEDRRRVLRKGVIVDFRIRLSGSRHWTDFRAEVRWVRPEPQEGPHAYFVGLCYHRSVSLETRVAILRLGLAKVLRETLFKAVLAVSAVGFGLAAVAAWRWEKVAVRTRAQLEISEAKRQALKEEVARLDAEARRARQELALLRSEAERYRALLERSQATLRQQTALSERLVAEIRERTAAAENLRRSVVALESRLEERSALLASREASLQEQTALAERLRREIAERSAAVESLRQQLAALETRLVERTSVLESFQAMLDEIAEEWDLQSAKSLRLLVVEPAYTEAKSLLKAGRYAEAVAKLQPLRRKYPDSVLLHRVLYRALEQDGRRDEAERLFREFSARMRSSWSP